MRKLSRALFCFVTCLLAPSLGGARQAPAGAPGTTSSSAAVDTSKEPVVYEQVRGHLRYEEDGSGSVDAYARIRVQTYSGVQKVGQLVFGYDSANAQLEVRSVRVTKPDGQVVTAGPDAIQDMTSPITQSAPTYTDLRQKHVVVPSLSPGDILEYETFTAYRPLTPGKIWQIWDLVSNDVCLDEQVDLDVSAKISVKTSTTGADGPELREEGGRNIWTWKTSNLPRAERPLLLPSSGSLPDVKTLLRGPARMYFRRIWITSFADWAELSAWYSGLERDRRVPTAEVRAKAEELTRDSHSDLEKVRAIYNYVARNIRYVSLSFGVGRFQPHFAADVLAHQYGDCKDKATLLEAMLQAVGINASTVLLEASGRMEEVPSPFEFDHAITYLVLDGKEMWLDSTLGVAPFGYLMPNVRGKHALITSPEKGSELRRIPSDLCTPTLYAISLEGRVTDDRKLDATLTFETRGDWEVLLRLGLVQSSVSQLQRVLEASAKEDTKSGDLAISDFDVGDPYDTSSPLRIHFRLAATLPDGHEIRSDEKPKSDRPERALSSKDLDELVSSLLPPISPNSGTTLGDEKEMTIYLKLTFGDKLAEKLAGELKSRNIDPSRLIQDFAEYEQNWNWQSPALTGNWRLATKMTSVSVDRSAEYSAFRSAVQSEMGELAYALGAPPSGGTPTLQVVRFAEALEEIHAEKFPEAQTLLESIVKEDPNYVAAWKSLGELFEKSQEWEKSREAYQRVIELAPRDSEAYSGLVRGYIASERYSDGIVAAKKQLEQFPDWWESHSNLGAAYMEAGKFDEAAEQYEAAARLQPTNPRLLVQIGRAYSRDRQVNKARSAFRRALQLDSSPLTLNAAAYYSADAGLDLKNAEALSRRSITALDAQLNAVKLEDFNRGTLELLAFAAAFWDTFGWIKFKQGDLSSAEKYLTAASDLSDESTIQLHMGRVEEALGHKTEAIRFYVTALTAAQIARAEIAANRKSASTPQRPLSPVEQEARDRLVALAGSEQAVNEQIQEASRNFNSNRTVAVPNHDNSDLSERLVAIVTPGPKIATSATLPGTKAHSKLLARFDSKTPPQTFPDPAVTSIPRIAAIRCHTSPAQCELEFLPNESASHAFSEDHTSQ
jgi:tetratricopeptide (TPR) repeat protein